MIKVFLAALVLPFAAVIPSFGDSAAATLGVSANVVKACQVTTTSIAFGDYDPLANASAPLNAAGAVTISCTRGTAPAVGLSSGTNGDGSARRMRGAGSALLAYELFRPTSGAPGAGCVLGSSGAWGDGPGGLFAPGIVTDAKPRAYTICARVGAGQSPSAGPYTDSVLVTVNF